MAYKQKSLLLVLMIKLLASSQARELESSHVSTLSSKLSNIPVSHTINTQDTLNSNVNLNTIAVTGSGNTVNGNVISSNNQIKANNLNVINVNATNLISNLTANQTSNQTINKTVTQTSNQTITHTANPIVNNTSIVASTTNSNINITSSSNNNSNTTTSNVIQVTAKSIIKPVDNTVKLSTNSNNNTNSTHNKNNLNSSNSLNSSSSSNSSNSSSSVNISNSTIREQGNMSIVAPVHLSAEQKTYFSKPLALSQTPTTDIPYQDDGQSFDDFKLFLLEQAQKQGFSPSILQAIQNIQLNKRVISLDVSQYERIQVKPPVVTTNTTVSNNSNTNTNSNVTTNTTTGVSPNTNTTITTNPNSNTTTVTKPVVPAKPTFVPSYLMQKYLSLHITQGKVDRALSLLDNYRFMLDQISETYHVPVQVIIGLWGMETSFGKNQGNYKLLDALASLAYEGRRRQFFIKEFFNALRIIELNQFDPNNVLSSWAGAIGQIQFLPSSFLSYAVDGNGDGIINIWYSTIDSFASIANYLHKNNWDDQIPWGIRVDLTTEQYLNFKHKDALGLDSKNARTLAQWQELGVNFDLDQDLIIGLDTMPSDTKFWLVVPDNEPTYAYLVTKNYKVYLRWNRSKYFAFANGIFADRIYEIEQIRDKQDQLNQANQKN